MMPRYRVVLHCDDQFNMDRAVRALLYIIMSLSLNDAIAAAFQTQTYGSAHVVTCPREIAEFYAVSLKEFDLIATIEPA